MKKNYIIPQIEVLLMCQQDYILTGSPEGKQIEGGPTGNNGIPGDVGNTSDTPDPWTNGGNRAPGFFGDIDD